MGPESGFHPRLNRTSVGLKLELPPHPLQPAVGPQSNQRGIETVQAEVVVPADDEASIEPAWD